MSYREDGTWADDDESVANRVNTLQSQDSPLMRQAAAAGAASANRRGLQNSSIGIGAGIAATLGAVTPIASQEAQAAQTRNLAAREDLRTRDLAGMEDRRTRDLAGMEDTRTRELSAAQIASQDRANYSQALATAGGNYQSGVANTLANNKTPAAARTGAQASISNAYTSQQQQLAQIYGVKLNWGNGTSGAPTAYAAPGAGLIR